jgi:hypothetical protein
MKHRQYCQACTDAGEAVFKTHAKAVRPEVAEGLLDLRSTAIESSYLSGRQPVDIGQWCSLKAGWR